METAQYPNVDAVKIAPLFSLMDAPIFHADSSPWSRALNIALYGLVFISIWQVTGALIRQTWKYQRLPQRKAISGLLLLAILSTSVVFTMRCEHILPTILMQNGVWWYSYSKSAWVRRAMQLVTGTAANSDAFTSTEILRPARRCASEPLFCLSVVYGIPLVVGVCSR